MGPNRTYQCYSQWFCAATKGWGTPFSRRGFVGCRAGGQKSRTRTLLSGVWHAKYRNQHPKWCFDGRTRCAIPPLLVQNSENQEKDENQEVQKSVATPSLEMGFGNPKSAQEGQVLIPLPPPTPTLQTGNSQSQNPRENSPTEFPSGDFLRPSRPIFPMSVDQNWLQTGPLDKRSYGAGFFQVRETLLGLGGLSPPLEIPNFVDFGNFFAERRPAGNFLTAPPAGNPPSMETGRLETPQPPAETPHGSRGKFQESQIVPKVPHGSDKKLQDPQVVSENSDFVIFSDGTRVEVPKNRQSPAEFPPGTQGSQGKREICRPPPVW